MSVPVLSRLLAAWDGLARAARPAAGPPPRPQRPTAPAAGACHSPHASPGPALRANPYPEVTDPFCRLPLSTLLYRLEAAHLGDLMRLSVRMGLGCTAARWAFHGPSGALRMGHTCTHSTGRPAASPGNPIPRRPGRQREKRTLPGTPAGVAQLAHVAVRS